jgi:ubiquitin-like-conjugating enzyme ATG3
MNNILHKLKKKTEDIISSIKPTLKESVFYKEGKLTPEEYVEAGDYLVSKCPTWKWCEAKEGYYNKALPVGKQYLKTTVSSRIRADEYIKNSEAKTVENEDGWVEADLECRPKKEEKKVIEMDDDDEEKPKVVSSNVAKSGDDDDSDEFEIGDSNNKPVQENKPEEKKDEIIGDVIKERTYDITITYDFYYCVPRMWLMGYNENGQPLSDKEMTEDIMPEYRNKTVTIEPQTSTGIRNISVHPCRHSLLLKKMIQNYEEAGKKLEVYMSIVLFLKFLQSVVPTVNYDFGLDIALK